MAYVHRFRAGTHLIRYALVPMTTARWSPITQYVVFYPDLLAVGGGTHDMCACIVRQDYTGAHIHALGWTSPQRLFILRHLRRERNPKFKMTRQILLCSFLCNIFHPLHFAKTSAPSMCSFNNLVLYFKKESTLLLIASVINKLSTLSAPSMIDFFPQISTCLIRPSIYCLIHFSKRLGWLKSK